MGSFGPSNLFVQVCSRMHLRVCVQRLLQCCFIISFCGIFSMMQKSSVQWDYLVYTQIWPQAICIEMNETQPTRRCVVPDYVRTWTIHGIWPNAKGTKGPNYCNDSWPFRPDQIKDLEAELNLHWPNYIADEEKSSFWKHEWTKHGTCAASLAALDSEHKYFSTGLMLQKTYTIDRIFRQVGILPSPNVTYLLQDIQKALKAVTKTRARIMCMEARTKGWQALTQIEICLDKGFKPIDCERSNLAVGAPYETSTFTRLRRSVGDPVWDSYPYYPNLNDCLEELPIRYLPIKPGRQDY